MYHICGDEMDASSVYPQQKNLRVERKTEELLSSISSVLTVSVNLEKTLKTIKN